MQLGEWNLPAGFAVAPATVLAHYNPLTYPDPDAFRPEWFLERSYTPFEYMPFGGGHRRRCIGAAFATYEMAIVLGTLLSQHTWELIDTETEVPKRRNLTMEPSSRVAMRAV
jgi:cytochrome P450